MKRTKAQQALFIAKKLYKEAKCSRDFHNAFFGVGGKFGELFPERADREAFAKAPEYREILRMRGDLQQAELSEPVRERKMKLSQIIEQQRGR